MRLVWLGATCVWAGLAAGAAAQMMNGQMPPMGAPTPAGTAALLSLGGPGGVSTVTPAQLAAMPHHSITVENAHTHASETYAGVPLLTLLERVGAPAGSEVHGKALSEYLVATGVDGYKAVLALAEFEPDFHPGEVLVADTLDGKPLGPQGPFKLVVSDDKRPARCVHNLQRLELKAAE